MGGGDCGLGPCVGEMDGWVVVVEERATFLSFLLWEVRREGVLARLTLSVLSV